LWRGAQSDLVTSSGDLGGDKGGVAHPQHQGRQVGLRVARTNWIDLQRVRIGLLGGHGVLFMSTTPKGTPDRPRVLAETVGMEGWEIEGPGVIPVGET
jgi:hypothetical protein